MNQRQFAADNAPDDGENKLEWWHDFRANPIRALFDNHMPRYEKSHLDNEAEKEDRYCH
jgi:hypothetical protein